MTSDGSLGVSGVSEINAAHVMIATCLTMTDKGWTNKMSNKSLGVFGYTKVSFDSIDNSVVRDIADEIDGGEDFMMAFYRANAAQSSLKDRWLGYWRESSEIVEYSARSGNIPSSTPLSWVQLEPGVRATGDVMADTRVFVSEFTPLVRHRYIVDADAVSTFDDYRTAGEFLVKSDTTDDEALAIALSWEAPPVDASAPQLMGVQAQSSVRASSVVAQTVRFERELHGLPVATNGEALHRELLINDGSVIARSEYWPAIVEQARPRLEPIGGLLTVREAVRRAAVEMDRHAKADIEIHTVRPAYGIDEHDQLVPAYVFGDRTGLAIVVDAKTGALLK